MTQARVEIEAQRRRKAEARRKIPFLVEFGTIEDITEYAKRWNPSITQDGIDRVVKLFRAAKLARGHPQ